MSREAVALSRQLYRTRGCVESPLSFLYHTRTLLSPAWQNPRTARRTATLSFSTSSPRAAFQDIPFRESTSRNTANYNNVRIPESTITAPERAIFDRIFKDIVSNKSAKLSPAEDEDPFDDDPSKDVTLESIFEAAIIEAKKGPRKKLAKPEEPKVAEPTEPTVEAIQSTVVRPVLNTRLAQRNRFSATLQRSLDAAREAAMANQPSPPRPPRPPRPLRPARQAKYSLDMTDMSEYEETGRKIGEPLDEYERLIERARKKDMEQVTRLLEAASSDVELWRVLEKEVFARMEELTALLKREEMAKKATKAAAGKTRGLPSSKTPSPNVVEGIDTSAPPSPADATEDVKPKRPVGRPRKMPALEALTPTDPELPSPPTPESPTTPSPAAPPIPSPPQPHPLSILQTNYAAHLLLALRRLRCNHPISPYILSLLPTVKRLGPISYVLGASLPLYNELLYIRWIHHRDLHGCADLVAEMLEQGLGTDGLTHAVFQDASKERKKARWLRRKGVDGVLSAWWGLQGVISGWGRWRGEANRAERVGWEESERVRREREEMGVLDGEEEEGSEVDGEERKEGKEGKDVDVDVDVRLAEDGAREGQEEFEDVDVEVAEDSVRDEDAVLREERNSAVPAPPVRQALDVDWIFGTRKRGAE